MAALDGGNSTQVADLLAMRNQSFARTVLSRKASGAVEPKGDLEDRPTLSSVTDGERIPYLAAFKSVITKILRQRIVQ
jgi:hypothetical protein